jgi:hypothetical protein
MSPGKLKAAGLLARGLAGWASRGMLIGVGRQMMSLQATLLLHAAGAPLGFALIFAATDATGRLGRLGR